MATNTFFAGQVINSNAATRTVTVIAESHAGGNSPHMGYMMQGVPITSMLTHFLGFSDCGIPQPGTRVLCVSDSADLCYILGAIPQETLGYENIPARALLGAGYARYDEAHRMGHEKFTNYIYDNRRPQDVVDGEHVVSNEFGVMLGLFQQLAILKGSELSQVQCFVLDDLVRIISHNYQHYTALGEYNIYHDGKHIMAEFGATHKPAETYGRPAVDDEGESPIFTEGGSPQLDDSGDFYEISENERIKAIERFKIMLGSVGDFLHMFLVRPDPKAVRDLDGNIGGKPDTGLCDFHIGTDGGLHMRSLREVFIEKTNWIRVPHRKRSPEDPNGDDAETLNYEHKKKFEFNNSYKFANNPFAYALQIRDYIAYVDEKLGYQNAKKHTEDFHVNDSLSEENAIPEIKKIDKDTDLNLEDYKLRTAGIYLMPNGGITIRDAWSSAIIMEGGNIYIQPAKDLISQPLRNHVVKAGGNINMCSKKHVDISSTEEGMRLKSEKTQYLYSHNGGVILEAKGTKDVPGIPAPDKEAVEYIGGIVLKSSLGIYNYAEKNIVQYAKKKLLLQSLDNTDIVSNKTLTTYGRGSLQLYSDSSILAYSEKNLDLFSGGSAVFTGSTSTVLGEKGQQLGVVYDKKSIFIDVLYGVVDTATIQAGLGKAKKAKEELLKQTIFGKEANFDKIKFKYLKSTKYGGGLSPTQDAIPATLAQQDTLLTNLYNLSEWDDTEINETRPYPGKELWENFYLNVKDPPKNLELTKKVGDDANNKASSENSPASLTLEALSKYKVQN